MQKSKFRTFVSLSESRYASLDETYFRGITKSIYNLMKLPMERTPFKNTVKGTPPFDFYYT